MNSKTIHQLKQELADIQQQIAELEGAKTGHQVVTHPLFETGIEERLLSILTETSDFVGIASPDTSLQYINQAWRDFMGWSMTQDVTQTNIAQYFPPQHYKIVVQEAIPTALAHDIWQGETVLINPAGQTLDVSQIFITHKDEAGNPIYFSTIAHNITALKHQEKQTQTLFEISRGLSLARNEEELLELVAQPAVSAGAIRANLFYVHFDDTEELESVELVAFKQFAGKPPPVPVGSIFSFKEYPALQYYLSTPNAITPLPNLLEDENLDENFRQFSLKTGAKAILIIPLLQNKRWVGVISLVWLKTHQFSEAELFIYETLRTLVSPLVENLRLITNLEQLVQERTQDLRKSQTQAEATFRYVKVGICRATLKGQFTWVNQAWADITGYNRDELLTMGIKDITYPEDMHLSKEYMMQILSGKTPKQTTVEKRYICKDGSIIWGRIVVTLVTDEFDQQTRYLVAVIQDITTEKEAEFEKQHLQEMVINSQKQAIRELSTPIIPVMDGIIVLPLIGAIDSRRAQDLMRTMLKGIAKQRAKIVIMDITGVVQLDSDIAAYLDKIIQAARLKGASTIITGMSDAVAETIIDLGIDWHTLETVRDLQTGLVVALQRMGKQIIQSSERDLSNI